MVRIMTIADYDGAYSLWMNTPGMRLNELDDSREGVAKYLKRNPKTCFVAEEDGEIRGVILSGHDGRRGYIYHAAVSAKARGQGIGSALLEQAVAALKAEGIRKAGLIVLRDNAVGNSFWQSRGFAMHDDLNYRNKTLEEQNWIDVQQK